MKYSEAAKEVNDHNMGLNYENVLSNGPLFDIKKYFVIVLNNISLSYHDFLDYLLAFFITVSICFCKFEFNITCLFKSA